MKDCKACLEEDNSKLIAEYFRKRRKKKNEAKRVQHTSDRRKEDEGVSSIVFKATFTHCHEMQTCVDSGSDGKNMDQKTMQAITKAGAE